VQHLITLQAALYSENMNALSQKYKPYVKSNQARNNPKLGTFTYIIYSFFEEVDHL